MTPLYSYIAHKRERIEGWFNRVDAEIFCALLEHQNHAGKGGGLAEIGLHHGKSFIALCLGLAGSQKAYGIDVFENQQANLDNSGRGDRQIVESNLQSHGVDLSSVVIDPRTSEAVAPEDIVSKVGGVRFFSVDGGHWREIVLNDLSLSERTICDHGIIALDDFHRKEFPNVSLALFEWRQRNSTPIAPFAIGENKIYLCDRAYVDEYQSVLFEHDFLRFFLMRYSELFGQRVPVYGFGASQNESLRTRLKFQLKCYHSDFYVRFRKFKERRGS